MTTKKSLTVLLFLLVSFTSKIKAQISCEASFNVAMSVTNKLRAIFTNTSTPDIPGSTQYTWDFGDGDTTSIKNPSHIYAGPGNYIVKLAMRNFGLNACTDTTTYNLLILGSTSINEINSSINLNCYPNPIINTAAINYSLQKEEEIEIYVLDILGKM